ncbi:MAG: DUF1622 domain-containing protein [Anaerococcus sp.]|nr:DUF1622 domain-containing protein [Anaerococcus sp.]
MHEIFFSILAYVGLFIEMIGFGIIVVSVIKSFYKLAFEMKFDLVKSHKDISLSTGLSVALEFFLAAEIIKTITLRDQSELIYIGVLIMIRILMTLVIHWELKQKEREEKLEEKE